MLDSYDSNGGKYIRPKWQSTSLAWLVNILVNFDMIDQIKCFHFICWPFLHQGSCWIPWRIREGSMAFFRWKPMVLWSVRLICLRLYPSTQFVPDRYKRRWMVRYFNIRSLANLNPSLGPLRNLQLENAGHQFQPHLWREVSPTSIQWCTNCTYVVCISLWWIPGPLLRFCQSPMTRWCGHLTS